MGVPQNELEALQQIAILLQQVVVELRRVQEIVWVLSGRPQRGSGYGFDDSPTPPAAVPEVPIL